MHNFKHFAGRFLHVHTLSVLRMKIFLCQMKCHVQRSMFDTIWELIHLKFIGRQQISEIWWLLEVAVRIYVVFRVC